MKRILKDSAKCIFVFCFFVGQLLGCSQEATLDNTEGVGDGVVAPVLPFQQLVTFASGDSQYHVTKDFSLSLDNGSWTSSDTSVLSVDSSGRAIIKEYSGGGYSRDIELRNERGGAAVVTVRYPLPYDGVGYDKLTLHGKFRSYRPDTTRGDSMTHWCSGELLNDGSTCADCPNEDRRIPEGAIVGGVEYPTYWSRLPLSIHADNHDTTKGLYAIQDKGTSAIFPNNEQGLGDRADNNMRQCTAGVYIAFETDSTSITVDAEYLHSSSTNVTNGRAFSGLDLYSNEGSGWVYKYTFKDNDKDAVLDATYSSASGKMTSYILMLPTYNGFEFGKEENPSGLKLLFSEGATTYEIDPFNEQVQKPILIYGTSITQGDGASGLRPGATYAAQIMWATGREVINMGVAGSAQMEYKMADFLSQIESEVFVIDPGWNLTSTSLAATNCNANGDAAAITNEEVVKRAKYMVETYRKKHPNTPIIVCPKYLKSNNVGAMASTTAPDTIDMPKSFDNDESYLYGRESFLLYKAYLELKEKGVKNLYWAEQGVPGNESGQPTNTENLLYGTDLHPPIQGMTDIANFILPVISQAAPHLYSGGEVQVPAS